MRLYDGLHIYTEYVGCMYTCRNASHYNDSKDAIHTCFNTILNKPALTYKRHTLGWRHALCHHQLEHSESQKNGHSKGNLFPRVCGEVETQRSQERDEEAGEEEVEDVEGGAALQEHCIGDVGVRVRATAVHDDVLGGRHPVALPLHIFHKI